MRLYPPAFLIARAAAGPGYGSAVLNIASQRHGADLAVAAAPAEKLWDQPNAFRPSRFLPGNPPPDRFAYLPFGVGSARVHRCAVCATEATLALAKLIGSLRGGVARPRRR